MSQNTGQYEYRSFDAMGTRISFWVDRAAGRRAQAAFRAGETFIRAFDQRLSRFKPESELCALNADPRETVEVSSLMARFVAAAIEIAHETNGLIDPTLIEDVEDLGYRQTRAGMKGAPLSEALEQCPAPTPASPDTAERWREFSVDMDALTVTRTPGLRLDSGGCGKGLAADQVAAIWSNLLEPGTGYIVDCGGDMRVGTLDESSDPYVIQIDTVPQTPEPLSVELRAGGIATSGIGNRIWRTDDGFAHHLIDPGTGMPAWTGVASATAIGPTALAAESIAKLALLTGPTTARELLTPHGGVIVEFDGTVTELNPTRTEVHA
ncbi:MAG: FAD:protein FMN transferase [Thermoleophilaceae bacterium]|nr:FAD:protein FMN transferase [Thermoleophilaceae bacterium]